MLLDPVTLDLAPVAQRIPGAKLELPASQLELNTPPAATVGEAIAALADGRRDAAAAADGIARLGVAGVHPFAAPLGELNTDERYEHIVARYGDVARAQLVCALQVHVAVGTAERSLAVYNALRGHLPELAALAANAPFHAGRDTGFASVRPLINGLLPRQNVPPSFASWDEYADALAWSVPEPGSWWWELRPHLTYGTLEIRVCDAQTTLEETAAVTAYAHALVAWLAERDDLTVARSWQIAENRWAALRHGVEATFKDYVTSREQPVRDLLLERVETLGAGRRADRLRGRAGARAADDRAQRCAASARGGPGGRGGVPRRALPHSRPRSSAPGARNRMTLWVPSQNGRMRDFPQRQRAMVFSRPGSITVPS